MYICFSVNRAKRAKLEKKEKQNNIIMNMKEDQFVISMCKLWFVKNYKWKRGSNSDILEVMAIIIS